MYSSRGMLGRARARGAALRGLGDSGGELPLDLNSPILFVVIVFSSLGGLPIHAFSLKTDRPLSLYTIRALFRRQNRALQRGDIARCCIRKRPSDKHSHAAKSSFHYVRKWPIQR